MIESIQFRNFKVLRDAKLHLGRCNILVGANGTGKSTVLQALSAVREPRSNKFRRILSLGAESDSEKGASVEVTLNLSEPFEGLAHVTRWNRERVDASLYPEEMRRSENVTPALAVVNGIRVYSLDAQAIAAPVPVRGGTELGSNGSGLAAVLDDLRDTQPERFEAINQAVANWLPDFRAIMFEKPGEGRKAIVLQTADGRYRIPAQDLSQGTLLALAMLTLAHLPAGPSLLALEEPDRGLHPRLLRHVRDALYRLAYPEDCRENRPPVQVVATTHSPYFLDLFRDHPEEVVIGNRTGHNVSFDRLSDRPDIREILGEAPLGEIWYSGILGGVPASP